MKKLLITLIIIGITTICFAQDDHEKSEFQKLYDKAYPKTVIVECTTLVRYKDSRTYYDPDVSPDGPPQYIKDRYLKDKYVKDSSERYNIYSGEESYRTERYYGHKRYYENRTNYGYKRHRYNWYRGYDGYTRNYWRYNK